MTPEQVAAMIESSKRRASQANASTRSVAQIGAALPGLGSKLAETAYNIEMKNRDYDLAKQKLGMDAAKFQSDQLDASLKRMGTSLAGAANDYEGYLKDKDGWVAAREQELSEQYPNAPRHLVAGAVQESIRLGRNAHTAQQAADQALKNSQLTQQKSEFDINMQPLEKESKELDIAGKKSGNVLKANEVARIPQSNQADDIKMALDQLRLEAEKYKGTPEYLKMQTELDILAKEASAITGSTFLTRAGRDAMGRIGTRYEEIRGQLDRLGSGGGGGSGAGGPVMLNDAEEMGPPREGPPPVSAPMRSIKSGIEKSNKILGTGPRSQMSVSQAADTVARKLTPGQIQQIQAAIDEQGVPPEQQDAAIVELARRLFKVTAQ